VLHTNCDECFIALGMLAMFLHRRICITFILLCFMLCRHILRKASLNQREKTANDF
jgi:hypothetical protein